MTKFKRIFLAFLMLAPLVFGGCYWTVECDKFIRFEAKNDVPAFVCTRSDFHCFWAIILPPMIVEKTDLLEIFPDGNEQILDSDKRLLVALNPLDPKKFFSHLELPEKGAGTIEIAGTQWRAEPLVARRTQIFYRAEYFYGLGGVSPHYFPDEKMPILTKIDLATGTKIPVLNITKNRKIQKIPNEN